MLTNSQVPNPERSHPLILFLLPPLVTAALLIFAMTKWFQWQPAFLQPSWNAAFHLTNGAWRRLPELRGEPQKLQVSAGGTVWALTWHHGFGSEIARLDGSAWRVFQSADLGARGLDVDAGFVVVGEEVWAATEKGLLHWDGGQWKFHPHALSDASSMAAAQGEAWLMDEKGALSHFDGTQWSGEKVALPRSPGVDEDEADAPELARTDDGSLWVVRNGVLRRDGSTWAEVKPEGEDLQNFSLVGAAGDRIWLGDGRQLRSVDASGNVGKFGPEEMGFQPREYIYHVMELPGGTAGRLYVATNRGVLEFDRASWQRLPPPGAGVRGVVDLQAASTGDLFAIGNIPNATAQRFQLLIRFVPLLMVLGVVAVTIWMVRLYKGQRLREHRQLQFAVEHATGAVPDEFARDERLLAKQSSWWSASVTVGVTVGAMAGYSITRMFFPRVPAWTFLAIALGLHVVVTLGQTLVKRTPKPWDPIEPGGPGFDWGPTRRALPVSLAVFLLMNVGAFPKWMGDPVLWLLYGIMAFTWYVFLEQKLIHIAIRRGDYDGALKIVKRFRILNPEGGPALMRRGHILLLAGRYRESEEALRGAILRLRARAQQANVLEFLGDALLEQGRYDEAQRSYEAAIHTVPSFRRPYRGLAEIVLRQGRDASRALQYVESIAGKQGPPSSRFTINGKAADDYWALKAWALAECGRGAEVDQVVEEAIHNTNSKSRPDLAATYRRLGLAMRALGRQAEADQYLKQAAAADPNGRWSELARAALAEKSVWKV